jgi:uncharacterized protein YbjT (DUF2867 family)
MQSQTAVVIGATGLIGSKVVETLLKDTAFDRVRILVRKAFPVTSTKLEVQFVDFNNTGDLSQKIGKGDAIFCCVGTTQKKVKGDLNAYRKVDYDIPVNTARIALTNSFKKYLLVSSVGANAKSSNFYLKLKGEVEEEISAMLFESIHIFQPSMLLGQRKEFRFGELIGKVLIQPLSFLLAASLRKYKPIQASEVAKAMVAAAKKESRGINVYTYDAIKALARS